MLEMGGNVGRRQGKGGKVCLFRVNFRILRSDDLSGDMPVRHQTSFPRGPSQVKLLGFKHSTQVWTVNCCGTTPNPAVSQKYFFSSEKHYLYSPTEVKIPVYTSSCIHLLAKICIHTSHVLTVR